MSSDMVRVFLDKAIDKMIEFKKDWLELEKKHAELMQLVFTLEEYKRSEENRKNGLPKIS